MISKDEIKHIAFLSRLEFGTEELEKFTDQFNQILKFFEQLQEIDTSSIEPLTHPLPLTNVFREDVVGESLEIEDVLKNAPQPINREFGVPKIV